MKLLITREIPDAGIKILEQYPSIEIDYRKGPPLSEEALLKAVVGVDAILPVIPDKITQKIIEAAGQNLKIIAHYAVGYDNIDIETATKNKVYVSNTPGDLTESVAEFTLGLIYALSKNIVTADKFVRNGNYQFWDPMLFLGPTLRNKVLGIIGMGRIGQHLARLAHGGLKMKILYSDPKEHIDIEKECDAKKVELEELLTNSDFVSLNCPLIESTRHLINQKELELMKPTAYLINTARGPIVNEAALYEALKNNTIEGAALDVFEDEPSLYNGLTSLNNIILTPHIASATREARIQMARMAAQNIIDVLIKGTAPTNLVNMELADKIGKIA
ncbi:D-glycerate dehydrogenase [Candidatus Nomurabacteria bacterium]|uniref:D-glycerate dehydrogenase n=1 Tax=candidate division WWE3 bacterium TaxID=2053526 RepID=A0A955DZ74_UNCKA|nr:D-glycerate dehydrogenase [candidate division WWE3 bacterium]MCB9823560.1 D-glycerate dehydrogenase [Candidatus Nomurabacteria bacterium]MCB9827355.1 D-glycerate dehydrogenase [Candidatus Nomurabacteria bacterium]HXK53000.1 D-glycerate dehydrogenase [bacterium]